MRRATHSGALTINGYDDRDAEAFASLSREWLERYFTVDERDRKYIDHPRESIIDQGGEIFFARLDGVVVGTVAAIRMDSETVELAKLAVTERAQGLGIGRQLSEAVIAWSREAGARKVVLVSASQLEVAIALYERLGFVHTPQVGERWYPEADVYMELLL
jgi:GNAT superfamily N-acetyltransferase